MNSQLKIVDLTDTNFNETVLKSSELFLVAITANWNGASHLIFPIIEKIMQKFRGQLKAGNLDFERNSIIPEKFHVCQLPALLLFKEGQAINFLSGPVSFKILEEVIQKSLETFD